MHVLSRFSLIQLFVTLWMIARQVPLSTEVSRQEYWSGLLPLGDLPKPEIKSIHILHVPCIGRWILYD